MARKKKPVSLYSFLLPKLRRLTIQWPGRQEVFKRARVEVDDGFFKNGNPKTVVRFKCEKCGKLVTADQLEIDHIDPVSNFAKWGSWDAYLNALFCTSDKLQALCSDCHQVKTNAENLERVEKRKKVKKNIDK